MAQQAANTKNDEKSLLLKSLCSKTFDFDDSNMAASSWSLPESKNRMRVLSRSMTSDALLKNAAATATASSSKHNSESVSVCSTSSSNDDAAAAAAASATAAVAGRTFVEKYVVKDATAKNAKLKNRPLRQSTVAGGDAASGVIFVKQSSAESCSSQDSCGSGALAVQNAQKFNQAQTNQQSNLRSIDRLSISSSSSSDQQQQKCSDDLLQTFNCRKILDFLFVSNKLKCALNKSLLCQLNIQYLINLSGWDLNQLPNHLKSASNNADSTLFPCRCQNQQQQQQRHHSVVVLDVLNGKRDSPLPAASFTAEKLHKSFEEVNEFISKGRVQNRKILIFDERNAWSRCAAFVVQYTMSYYGMRYADARASFVAQLKTAAAVDDPTAAAACDNIETVEPALHVALQKWEAVRGAAGGGSARSGGDAAQTYDKTSRSQSATVIDRKFSGTKHIAWT